MSPVRENILLVGVHFRVFGAPVTILLHGAKSWLLRKRGIRAQIPKRVWKTKKNRGRPIKKVVPRFQAERTFAWFQKKYRRLVVRWERIAACFEAFLALATVHLWIHRLIVG